MIEKIGQVILDDTNYSGKDLYSDGVIEDEMLEIAENYPEEKWNQVIAERKSWPILYHFSHIRENILSWLLQERIRFWRSVPAVVQLQEHSVKKQKK